MSAQLLLPLMLAIPAAIAGLLGSGRVRRRSTATLVSAAALICVLLLALTQVSPMLHGQVLRWSVDWFPALGLDFKLRLDALAWLFVLLISGIGTLVVVYANYYLGKDEDTPRFYAGLLAFAAAMLGVVTAGNLLLLVVFWEFTSLSSFLLISFWSDKPEARAGARMALTVTAGGGLALLAGVLLIGQVVGSLDLDVVLGAGDLLRADPRYPWILGLVLLGAFTKSAQFPFHFWLPQAMAAPTPVSALLHSATLVKAGVFLLARLYPALSGTPEWLYLVAGTGLLTLLIGSWKAIFQHDIKGLLAYSTIAHLGLITLLLGLESPLTTVAAVFHMINHATFKASLFMAAGIIDHECGTRDMRRLHGLMRHLPWTGALAVVAAAAMAGVPLLNGFLSKEMFFTESLAVTGLGMFNVVVPLGALLAGMFGVAYSTRFIHDVFFGQALTPLALEPHEPPRWMRWPVEVLVLLCIAVGSFPAWTIVGILDAAAVAAAGTPMPAYSLRLWHGFNLPLLMSAIAFAGGLALYFAIYRGGWLHRHQTRALASALFQRAMSGLTTLAQRSRRATELGLTMQLRVLLVSGLALALSASLLSPATWPTPEFRLDAPWPAWLIAVGIVVLTIAVVAMHRQRVRALVLLGAIGLLVSLSFALLSAPDLALTQLLVEVASVLLLLLALRRLPLQAPAEYDAPKRSLDALIALSVGGGVALLCHRVLTQPAISISDYFLQQALPLAGGTNAVNVIIVDFRGLDTLGEMTVFAIAAIVVAGLLPRSAPAQSGHAALLESAHPLLLRTLATWLLPFALLISVYLLLRGHNQPGGGFIGGLTAAGAIVLLILAHGRTEFDRQIRWPWKGLLVSGLLLAVATAAAAWAFDYPFLTSYYQYAQLPLIGKLPLASVFLFDLGVYLAVAAGTVYALSALAGSVERGREAPWNY